jgi:hypothetical protein
MRSLVRDKNLSSAKEQDTSFRKIPCVHTGISSHLASFQHRITHSRDATGMLASDSGWYRAIEVIRIRAVEPIHQPSQCIERTLHGRLSGIHRKNH